MIETGAVIARDEHDPTRSTYVSFWHNPPGRSSGHIPDTRTLWDILWAHHQSKTLVGFAHTHPGNGIPGPSMMDISTFVAIEDALGRPLIWWIASADRSVRVRRVVMDSMPGREVYGTTTIEIVDEPNWMHPLRQRSNMFENHPYRAHGGGMAGHDND